MHQGGHRGHHTTNNYYAGIWPGYIIEDGLLDTPDYSSTNIYQAKRDLEQVIIQNPNVYSIGVVGLGNNLVIEIGVKDDATKTAISKLLSGGRWEGFPTNIIIKTMATVQKVSKFVNATGQIGINPDAPRNEFEYIGDKNYPLVRVINGQPMNYGNLAPKDKVSGQIIDMGGHEVLLFHIKKFENTTNANVLFWGPAELFKSISPFLEDERDFSVQEEKSNIQGLPKMKSYATVFGIAGILIGAFGANHIFNGKKYEMAAIITSSVALALILGSIGGYIDDRKAFDRINQSMQNKTNQ